MMLQFSAEVRRDPFAFYAQLREASPVLRDPASGVCALFDYESVKRALIDPQTFSSAASPPGSAPAHWLIFSDPPRHSRLRALIGRAFTPRTVLDLEPRVQDLARGLVEEMVARIEPDLVAELAAPLPMMVIAELLGAPPADWPRLRAWSDAILGLAQTVFGDATAAVAAFSAARAEMREYLRHLLSASDEGLLARLARAEVDGEKLSEDEVLGFFELLVLAGHETTTNLIANSVLCLMEHRRELLRLRASPSAIPATAEEVLRYRSPVQAVFRVARTSVELHGQTIPEGALVLAVIGSANRDPSRFADPDRFDAQRDPNPHLAFGHGIHFCVGAALARLEARVALTELLRLVTGFQHASDPLWEPRAAFHVHGPSRLLLRLERA